MGHSSKCEDCGMSVPAIVEQPCGLYPGIETFSVDYDAEDYCDWVDQSNGDPLPAPLVMYLQNGCAAGDGEHATMDVARAIERELQLQGNLFDDDRPLKQLILADSIATDWSDDQLYRLVATIQSSFYINHDSLDNWCACSGGVIPSRERLRLLRVLGFNHLRLMPALSAQATLPVEKTAAALEQAGQLGFQTSILDLSQLPGGWAALESALGALLPRVLPGRIRTPVPANNEAGAVDAFMAAFGYRDIGLGWYLQAGDGWWQARHSDRLYWTLLGFTELHNPDIVGIGPGAVSAVCDFYGINEMSLRTYAATLDDGILPVVQGVVLEDADVLRREIIAMILASSCIRVAAIENKWGISFEHFFACESELLRTFERNHWVSWQEEQIDIRTHGRRELMEICRVFDGRRNNPLTHAPHPGGKSAGAACTRSGYLP